MPYLIRHGTSAYAVSTEAPPCLVALYDKPGLRRIYVTPYSNGMRSIKRDITVSKGTTLNRKIHFLDLFRHNALFKTIHVVHVDKNLSCI